jgi:autotransporter passenger strand-loop-strand repeat protein
VGTPSNDVLDGDNGNTFMSGGDGGDIYLYDRGDGNDTIQDNQTNILITAPDVVDFGPGLTPSDVTFTRTGNSDNLVILVNGDPTDSLTILGQFDSVFTGVFGTANFDQIEGFQFADGTQYSSSQVELMVLAAEEAIPHNTIYGFDGADIIDPGVGGNDFMSGGNGDDTYLFGLGYGNDTILDGMGNILSGTDDTVEFNADISPSDVTFSRSGNSPNLVITVNGDTADSLTILDQFDSTFTGVFGTINFNQIESFVFANGVTYNATQIEQLVIAAAEAIPNNTIYGFDGNDYIDPGVGGNDYMSGGNGDDTYAFGFGYGHDTIYDNEGNILSGTDDTVLFNANVNPADVSIVRNGASNDFTLVLSDGSSLAIVDQFYNIWAGPFGDIQFDQIENFQFQNAAKTDWTPADIEQMAIAAKLAQPDGAANGFWNGAYFDPGTGAGGHLMVGEGGTNTYVFGLGYGDDTVEDSGGGEVLLNADVNPADVTFVRDASNDMTIVLSDGSQLDIENQFGYVPYAFGAVLPNQVAAFQFQDANSTELTTAQIEQMFISTEGQQAGATVYSYHGGDTLNGAGGNETLIGVNGANTFLFGLDYGHETVELSDDGYIWDERATGVVSFGPGILPSAVTLVANATPGNLQVDIAGATDTLTIDNYAALLSPGWAGASLTGFQFSNGTFWSAAQITTILETDALNGELPTIGSTLTGPFPNNYVDPGLNANHDMVSAGGDNTYVFGLGYGDDTIHDSSYGGSEILFNSGVSPSAVRFSRGGTNFWDLTITLADGSQLDISNEFIPTAYGFGANLENDVGFFQFQDASHTELTLAQVESDLIASEEAVSHSTIYSFYGGDTLDGASGDDTFVGVHGANTILFGLGDGAELLILNDDAGSYYSPAASANVVFGAGIDPSSITLVADNTTNTLSIGIAGTSDSLTVANYSSVLGSSVLSFQFADGTVWNTAKITNALETSELDAQLAVFGGPLNGPFPDNYVDPGLGGDHNIISAGGDNTYVFGFGYGDDTIHDSSYGGSEILFGPGVTPSTVQFTRGGTNYWDLTITLADGSQLDISNEFIPTPYGFGASIENDVGYFQFQDQANTTLTIGQMINELVGDEEATPYSTIYSLYGGYTLNGYAGNNTLVAFDGANTIMFGAGYGNEYVSFNTTGSYYSPSPSENIIFGAGIGPTSITLFTDGGSGNLTIRINGTSDSLTIEDASWLTARSLLSFQFSDGTIWDSTTISTMVAASTNSVLTWYGSATNETLVGNNFGPNIFYLAPGGDHVTFGSTAVAGANNVVDYSIGDGAVTIDTNGGIGSIDFGTGISLSNLSFIGDPATDGLLIDVLNSGGSVSGDSIFIPEQFSSNSPISDLSFADGSSVSSYPLTWIASATQTVLVGASHYQNLFDLAPGNDTVTFSSGSNIGSTPNCVLFGYGDGNAIVYTNGQNGGIELAPGITLSDFKMQLNPSGSITLTLLDANGNPTGDNLTFSSASNLSYLDLGSGPNVGLVNLLITGTQGNDTLNPKGNNDTLDGLGGNDFLEGASGSDAFVYKLGYGIDYIDAYSMGNSGSRILMGPGITASDITLQRGGGGPNWDLFINVAGANYIEIGAELAQRPVSEIEFSNGSTINLMGGLAFVGTTGNDSLVAWEGGDTLDGLTGNDFLQGASGTNTFVYKLGYGDDYIDAYSMGNSGSRILMGPGITASDITFQRGGGGPNWDLIIDVAGAGYVQIGAELSQRPVSEIEFADGSTINLMGNLAFVGTTGNDSLVAWQAGDTLDGLGGNDYEHGGGGNDGFVFKAGYGHLEISDVASSGGTAEATLDFGSGISVASLQVTYDSSGNLLITDGIAGDQLQIDGMYTNAADGVAKAVFSDGTTLSRQQIINIIQTEKAAQILGAVAGQKISDETSIDPFQFITLSGSIVSDSMTITLTGTSSVATDADGTLSGTNLTKIGTGLYTLAAATPAILTSELEALVFRPTAHQVAPAGTITTVMDLALTQNGLTTTNSITSIIVTAVNDAPVISGTRAGQATNDEATLKPLSTITITDPDFGATETVSITLTGTSWVATDADGTLSGTGLTKTGTGLYTLQAATPASLTSELEALTFTPTAHQVVPGGTVVSDFKIVATQNGISTVDTITSVIATAVNAGLSGVGLYTTSAAMTYLGSVASNIVVSSGATECVFSGGMAVATQVMSGGDEVIYSGGTATSTSDIGGQVILQGGTASSLTASNGGSNGVVVLSGGVLNGGHILAGTGANVSSGGVAIGVTVSGAELTVSNGGVASNTTLMSGSELNVYGGTAVGTNIGSGSTESLSAGAVVSGAVINSGGVEIVSSGGMANSTTISGGGTQYVYTGGSAAGAILSAGAHETVSSGGTVSGAKIAGGTLIVSSGGTLAGNIAFTGSAGDLALAGNPPSGATVSGFTIGDQIDLTSIVYVSGAVASVNSSTDKLTLTDGGNTYQLQLAGSFTNSAFVAASDGISGTDITVISAGPSGVVLSAPSSGSSYLGTVASNIVVSNGATEYVYNGGTAVSTHVSSGGTQIVYSGGLASNTSDLGGQIILSGGTASALSISNGGVNGVLVYSGGVASGGTVLAGTNENVSSGGKAIGVTISGAGLEVTAGGLASNSIVISGSHLDVSGGTVSGTSLGISSTENLSAGAIAISSFVNSGGTQNVRSAGTATSATISSGGLQAISAGGTASLTSVKTGTETVYAGGTATSTSDIGGQIIVSGGTAIGLTVSNGGVNGVLVYSGGIASGGTVLAGTNENISSGGRAIGVTVSGAGLEVTAGGVASNSVLVSGSHLDVSSGTVSGTSVGISSTENLSAGASASGSVVISGGTENVLSGGTATSTTVSSGGKQVVSSGGKVSGTTISGGGSEIVQSGATMSGSINFSGSNATLSIGGTVLPTNIISGFDASGVTTDDIVLTSYTYSTSDSVTLGSSNVLTLHLNGTISTLHFNTAQSFAGEYFSIQKNSQNQVVIVDPPSSASNDNAGAETYSAPLGAGHHDLHPAIPVFGGTSQMLFLSNSGSAAPETLGNGTNMFWPKLPSEADIWSFIPGNLAIPGGIHSKKAAGSLPTSAHFAGELAGEIINRSIQNGLQHGIFIHSGFG